MKTIPTVLSILLALALVYMGLKAIRGGRQVAPPPVPEHTEDQSALLTEMKKSVARLLEEVSEVRQHLTALERAQAQASESGSDPYTRVETWDRLVALIKQGVPVRVDSRIPVTRDATLQSSSALKFGPRGSLEMGATVRFNLPILNPDHHRIFAGVVLNEAYPDRWDTGASSVTGTFGGDNSRDPRWWGLRTTPDPNQGDLATATLNNDAIAGAALSSSLKNRGGGQLTVILPAGDINVHRTIRLDGLRCKLVGQGQVATRLWAHSDRYAFDVGHTIATEEFPQGTSPVVEIGYERQESSNPDEGFASGVVALGIVCPLKPVGGRVSGILWCSGLQEGSEIAYVTVENHSGMAIGGPRRQRLALNGPPQGHYSQVNGFRGNNWWIHGPNKRFSDVQGISIGGVTYAIDTVTVDHGREGGAVQAGPAVIAGAREGGILSNFHIEMSPKSGARGVGVLIPEDNGLLQRMTLTGISYLPSAPQRDDVQHVAVEIAATRGGVSCRSISCQGSERFGRAISDLARSKLSSGFHYPTAAVYVAAYDRQHERSGYVITTTDPDLR